ncbi:MAG: cytochrome c [Shewanella xiamenensis]|uniref:c-type cytochrome n=1 Tax=Shewanella TaxID=22 RepID=UPI0006DB7FB8|nr:cytochrome c [Shewanella sp. Sh95]KPN76785.1 cytochrome C [Shewanella sp. Sh95]MCD8551842.1 cytochrome c [Shewanella xiamenensis]MCD8559336.1 cytochrome c [Shewanella xiamenensis]
MKKLLLTLVAGTLLASTAQAHNFEDAKDAIQYRQSGFSLIAYNFGDMGAMMKGKKPFDAETFAMRAKNVAALSHIPFEGFIEGSDKGDTEALAKVWQDKADFEAKMKTFQENAAILATVAQKGDQAEIKQAFMDTGKSCKGCHDVYKKD